MDARAMMATTLTLRAMPAKLSDRVLIGRGPAEIVASILTMVSVTNQTAVYLVLIALTVSDALVWTGNVTRHLTSARLAQIPRTVRVENVMSTPIAVQSTTAARQWMAAAGVITATGSQHIVAMRLVAVRETTSATTAAATA
jgi:hypothetical protein